MSNVIRLNKLLDKLNAFYDTLYLNGTEFGSIDLFDMDKLFTVDPLVHIDLVETDYEEGCGPNGTCIYQSHRIYVTIV